MRLPASKSVAARWLILAAQADGTSRFTGMPDAEDTRDLLGVLELAGVEVRNEGRHTFVDGLSGPPRGFSGKASLGEGAATARFALAWLAAGQGEMSLKMGPSLAQRPMDRLVDCLNAMGARIRRRGPSLELVADGLAGGPCDMVNAPTSQFASAMLLAGPSMAVPPVVRPADPELSGPYLHLTRRALDRFGWPRLPLQARNVTVPPDASAAALALAASLVTGRPLRIDAPGDEQPDRVFPDLLRRAGLALPRIHGKASVPADAAWPDFTLCFDLGGTPDLAPAVAVLAARASAGVVVTGAPQLAAKESHRIHGLVDGLRAAGLAAEPMEDGFRTGPATPLRPGVIEDHGDHRLAMAWGILGLLEPGIRTSNPGCVAKSWPSFWVDLATWAGDLTGAARGAEDPSL